MALGVSWVVVVVGRWCTHSRCVAPRRVARHAGKRPRLHTALGAARTAGIAATLGGVAAHLSAAARASTMAAPWRTREASSTCCGLIQDIAPAAVIVERLFRVDGEH